MPDKRLFCRVVALMFLEYTTMKITQYKSSIFYLHLYQIKIGKYLRVLTYLLFIHDVLFPRIGNTSTYRGCIAIIKAS